MNLDESAFQPLDEAIRQAFNGGGVATVEQIAGASLPERISDRGRLGCPQCGRRGLAARPLAGPDPQYSCRPFALPFPRASPRQRSDKGRIGGGRAGQQGDWRREGVVIGLTTVHSDYVARARYELLSGEPDRLRAYLNRRRRDKRFDRTITAAIRDGKPIPTKLVAGIVDR